MSKPGTKGAQSFQLAFSKHFSCAAGLPPHLQVVKEDGSPSFSTRRQFHKGKAPRHKRGK